jgi:hypothetical protein
MYRRQNSAVHLGPSSFPRPVQRRLSGGTYVLSGARSLRLARRSAIFVLTSRLVRSVCTAGAISVVLALLAPVGVTGVTRVSKGVPGTESHDVWARGVRRPKSSLCGSG